MKIKNNNPPRKFSVGIKKKITISDCGNINLKNNEQISFITDDKKEYDVVRKEWGFYATPSINGRLKKQGFKTALVKNSHGLFYVMLVEKEKIELFKKYLLDEKNSLIKWLDEV